MRAWRALGGGGGIDVLCSRLSTHEALLDDYFTEPLELTASDRTRQLRQPDQLLNKLKDYEDHSKLPAALKMSLPYEVRCGVR